MYTVDSTSTSLTSVRKENNDGKSQLKIATLKFQEKTLPEDIPGSLH
jgi:hypothetical protein